MSKTVESASKSRNGRCGPNHSKYIGVFWCKQTDKWHASLRFDGNRKISMGRHMTEEAAALAYDKYVRKLVRRIDKYNFPDKSDTIAVAESDRAIALIPDKKVPQDDEFFGPLTSLDKIDSREGDTGN